MFDVISAYFVAACVLRTKSCNLHCNVFSHLFEVIVYNICLNVNQNTDFTAHMSIRSNETVLLFYLLETTDVHVLADGSDLMSQLFANGLVGIEFPRLCQESFYVCCSCIHSLLCNLCYIATEFLVLCNEVCLSVYFYSDSFLSILGYVQHNDTLSCDSASFFLSSSKSFFSQELHCFVHITFGSCKSFLAVHHTSTAYFS